MSAASIADPLELLRSATRGAHEALEASPWLDTATSSLRSYGTHLGRLRAFHRAAAAALLAHATALRTYGIGTGDDLKRLDVECATLIERGIRIPEPQFVFPALPTGAHAAGCRYVVEGSAIGGVVICQTIRRRLQWESPFYRGSGPQTAARWRAFRSALRAAAPQLEFPSLVAGAAATFAAYSDIVACTADANGGPATDAD